MAINDVSVRSFNAGFSELFFEDEQFAAEIDTLVKQFGKDVTHAVESLKKRKGIPSVDMSKITVRVLLQDDVPVVELPSISIDEND